MLSISTEYIRNIIRPRPADMHKGQAGRVLIIAGSFGMTGAAVLAARGALYSGAGIVKAAVPEELFNIMQISVPEAMCIDRKNLNTCSIPELKSVYEEYDAIAIGPGLGVSNENHKILLNLLNTFNGPVVVDADALNCIAEYGYERSIHKGPIIMTPHPGEANRLLANAGYGSYKELGREETAKVLSDKYNATIVLKGAGTLVSDNELYLNPTGNPGMATGGSGDVLTGIITAFLAQKWLYSDDYIHAVNTGVFIHGLAGDIAAENIGEYGMTSADIADAVSVAIKEMVG